MGILYIFTFENSYRDFKSSLFHILIEIRPSFIVQALRNELTTNGMHLELISWSYKRN